MGDITISGMRELIRSVNAITKEIEDTNRILKKLQHDLEDYKKAHKMDDADHVFQNDHVIYTVKDSTGLYAVSSPGFVYPISPDEFVDEDLNSCEAKSDHNED